MQNTELHNALPAPFLPSSLHVKYIKGGVLDPQCLRAENSFFIFTVMWMIILHLFFQRCLCVRAWLFFWVLKQHFLSSTHHAVKEKYCFLHFTRWQIEMCSFPHCFKKWVGTGEVPPAVTFLHTLTLHLPAFPASRHSNCSHTCELSAKEIRPWLFQIGQRSSVSISPWKSWFPWHSQQPWKEARRGPHSFIVSLIP